LIEKIKKKPKKKNKEASSEMILLNLSNRKKIIKNIKHLNKNKPK
jgi:hypothetical protein